MVNAIAIRHYVDQRGRDVFDDWFSGLADVRAQAKIAARINRIAAGNFGDCKPLGKALYELRIDWGPGYRVYYAMIGQSTALLLCGGRKGTQAADIARAALYLNDYKARTEKKMRRKSSVSHDDAMIRRIRKSPEFAAEYLRAALEDSDEPRVLLLALRHVAQARGITKIAKAAGIERESLYRALSANGNPRLSTLHAVAKAAGLKLSLEAA